MATITLSYNAKKTAAKKIIEVLLATGLFEIKKEEKEYNPEFVEMIKKADKGSKTVFSKSKQEKLFASCIR